MTKLIYLDKTENLPDIEGLVLRDQVRTLQAHLVGEEQDLLTMRDVLGSYQVFI